MGSGRVIGNDMIKCILKNKNRSCGIVDVLGEEIVGQLMQRGNHIQNKARQGKLKKLSKQRSLVSILRKQFVGAIKRGAI